MKWSCLHKADYAKKIRLFVDLLPLVTIILIGLKRKNFHLLYIKCKLMKAS